jgi:serum/glucocorticoid-regulated kinase 2
MVQKQGPDGSGLPLGASTSKKESELDDTRDQMDDL